jgi:hypothetical protein
MSIPREAYKVLEDVVGSEYISEDPVDMEAYRMGACGGYEADMGYGKVMAKVPACVIMPKTTEEVQKIVKVCNRYKIRYIPAASAWMIGRNPPHRENALFIDLKRMDGLEIDEQHMYAIVEPAVIFSQFQEQLMRRGLYITTPGGGSQVSVVVNHISFGYSPLNYRNGWPSRRVLGMEWVFPDGELVRTGSLALGDDPFWGEGPGPEIRGLFRGAGPGWLGSFGICTKMAVKVFPFQPEKPEPTGISPNTTLELPLKRTRWINFTMPSREALVEGMFKISEAEIAAAMTKVPVFWRVIAKANTKEEFWDLWSKESEETVNKTHILRVLLVGYTSEEQMDYEERVLTDIMAELGGTARRTRPTDESWLKNADSAGMWVMCGGYVSVEYVHESLESAPRQGEAFAELKRNYTPPLMPDYGDPGWFQSTELGHSGYFEFLVYYDPEGDMEKVDQWYVDTSKLNVKKGFYTAFLPSSQPVYLTGPAYGPNYHLWLKKLKETFDPNSIANPPVPFDHDEFVERAEWMHQIRDWPVPEEVKAEAKKQGIVHSHKEVSFKLAGG